MAYEAVCCGLELNPVTLNLGRYDDFFDKIPDSITRKWKPLEWAWTTHMDYNPADKKDKKGNILPHTKWYGIILSMSRR